MTNWLPAPLIDHWKSVATRLTTTAAGGGGVRVGGTGVGVGVDDIGVGVAVGPADGGVAVGGRNPAGAGASAEPTIKIRSPEALSASAAKVKSGLAAFALVTVA